MNDKKKNDFKPLQMFVENEVDASFRIKPEHELRSRLKGRLSGGGKQRQSRFVTLKPAPVLIGILVIFCGVLIGVYVVGKRSDVPSNKNYISRFLEGTPGIQTLSQWAELSRLTSEADHFSVPSLPKNFISFFRRVEEDILVKRANIQIPDINQYPVLDFKQILEILFEKKAIHQILIQFSQKNEEEKNG